MGITVPNRGGAFRAIGAKMQTRRANKQANAAVENNKWSQIQAGHSAGAFAPGRNVDWSPTAGQKAAESHAVFNTGTW